MQDYDCYGGLLKKKLGLPTMMPDWEKDYLAGRKALEMKDLQVFEAPIHIEGGSIHSDGQGWDNSADWRSCVWNTAFARVLERWILDFLDWIPCHPWYVARANRGERCTSTEDMLVICIIMNDNIPQCYKIQICALAGKFLEAIFAMCKMIDLFGTGGNLSVYKLPSHQLGRGKKLFWAATSWAMKPCPEVSSLHQCHAPMPVTNVQFIAGPFLLQSNACCTSPEILTWERRALRIHWRSIWVWRKLSGFGRALQAMMRSSMDM